MDGRGLVRKIGLLDGTAKRTSLVIVLERVSLQPFPIMKYLRTFDNSIFLLKWSPEAVIPGVNFVCLYPDPFRDIMARVV